MALQPFAQSPAPAGASPELRVWLEEQTRRLQPLLNGAPSRDEDETVAGAWTFDDRLTVNGLVRIAAGADYGEFSHDGSDFNMDFVNTSRLLVDGVDQLFVVDGGYTVADTRAVDDSTSAYSRLFRMDFKQRATLGFPGNDTFGGVLYAAPWSDASGGPKYQLAFTNTSNLPFLAIRSGDQGSAWGAWRTIPVLEDAMFLKDELYIDGDTAGHFESVTGNFGSVQVDGVEGTSGSWRGYSIGGRHVFMDNGAGEAGIYNDTNNHWMVKAFDGGRVILHDAGVAKLETGANGARVFGRLEIDDTSTLIEKGGNNSVKLATPNGHVTIGPENGSFCHIRTDRANFWFEDGVYFNGVIRKHLKGHALYHGSTSHLSGEITVSTGDPSGGANGDVWMKV